MNPFYSQDFIPAFLYPVIKMFPNISGWKKMRSQCDEMSDFIREVALNQHLVLVLVVIFILVIVIAVVGVVVYHQLHDSNHHLTIITRLLTNTKRISTQITSKTSLICS